MTYKNFIETIRDPNRKFNYYYAEQSIPITLNTDVIIPKLA